MGAKSKSDDGLTSGEADRLAALADLAILDTAPDPELDTLCRIAADTLGAQSAGISFVARDRQWFKARHNLTLRETSRDNAFCAHTVAARKPVVVLDSEQDERFSANPLVTDAPYIRFYVGAPIILKSGYCVGSLCVIDQTPRKELSQNDIDTLERLAMLAAQLIEQTRRRRFSDIAGKVIESSLDAVLAVDNAGTIIFLNPAAEQLFGYSRSEAIGSHVGLLISEKHGSEERQVFLDAAAGRPTPLDESALEIFARHKSGSEFPARLSLAPWGTDRPDGGYAAIIRDVTREKALEDEKNRSRAFLDGILENLPVMLFVKDAKTRKYRFVNTKMEKVAGRTAEQMLGHSDAELFPDVGDGFENRDKLAIQSREPFVHESQFERDDGTVSHIRTTRVVMAGPESDDQFILGIGEDLTKTRITEAENYRLARYDTLTGLLNRAKLADLLRDLVASNKTFALLSLDLDRFKSVNDQFGHLVGDAVLKQVGGRIESLVGSEDFAARIGGDEFMAVLIGDDLRHRAEAFAHRLISRIEEPMVTPRATVHLGASIGIAIFPDDATTTEKLRENADLALYRAKNRGRGVPCFFDDGMDAAVRDRRKLEHDLRRAVEQNLIGLAYQPIMSTASGRITSVEALARWTHPAHGLVPPDHFISLAEETGLIDRLGDHLIRLACEDACHWPEHVRVAVNLSPLQFRNPSFVANIEAVLEKTGLAPNRLQLEVTERVVLQNVEETFAQLEALRALGIQILIDDFGVGHSSLSYFQRFSFDKVKIDKSFIAEIESSRAARAIVEAVVGLGRKLDMGIVAEGVETMDQQEILTKMGCTHLQGYLFSKPTDIVTLRLMLDAQTKPHKSEHRAA
ncbi:sensor domain-containing phosphodiesterase [Pseudoblastomonas halimionae]|uniref:EAL domain-containing protein n=1 Tax=Alteriqipengyuania halimionae TaxID=1926630 RepID=A0A6I4U0F3_9SPHN|nr:EAL domain-containing protein [Alteriqipengyuania halimionae]MXP09256.1 EAL domain-containing protein [Alteriqipengyuania halimionae]